ncbi:protein mono-ADP-ribosyltransferase PARP9 [Labrus mixtus]|uniref:protein mono-ADP-ribosyltransferase PARP9 n=1 Tax=Labrus mixtus TaxID=508554 RepID=UPI0029C01534|nr:protein mono-ADP-ribosyltransferase PARP9 [Labrus mixtus]
MTSTLDVPLHGVSVKIVRQNTSDLCEVLQSKFGCTAVINGVDSADDFSSAQQKKPAGEDQPRFAFKLDAGVRVSVWRADLTRFKEAEAVVNAANTKLQHGGGLAGALSKAGGPVIQRESVNYIRKNGDLYTGDAIVTSAGSLPCKCIIHAVGPDLNHYSTPNISRAEPLLKKTIWSILNIVSENCLQSVAIPAISSGIFNYPLPQCADTIVSAVKEYYKGPHKHLPKEIFLVNHDEPSVQEMTRACKLNFMNYSQAAGSQVREDAKTSTHSLQIGKVHLMLKKGHIERQQTDVIVNTVSTTKDLKIGCISKALLKKAGDQMQREIYRASPVGHVIITNGYNLDCKNVFHTQATCKQILFESVRGCLQLAVQYQHKSIAFPAIGTGNVGIDKRDVAQIMLNAVAKFALMCQATLEVHVVIFPPDQDTFLAFENQMKILQKQESHPSTEHAFGKRDEFQGFKAASPQISLMGSEEATREADRWLQNLLFKTFSPVAIHNNFIHQFGEREDQQLSPLVKRGVSFEERFEDGRASIVVKGHSDEDVAVARLKVEAILCKVQEEFVKEETQEINEKLNQKTSFGGNTLTEPESQELKDRFSLMDKKLRISKVVKVVKVENPALETIFEMKKKQLNCSTSRTMFQCMPAQFPELVSRIGFHACIAPPKDPILGQGIYFAGTVEKAMDMWKTPNEEYVYFVEAEVLMGSSTSGKRDPILPSVGKYPQILYDSVSEGTDIAVIFSGYQALPTYIITCRV